MLFTYCTLHRPLVWSQSSVIWSAHPTQALIIGRHFSSSKQFVLQCPTPVISALGSFDPPTVIAVSPTDDWLFAFYPRKDGEGVGCIWKRGGQIDNWQVKESWTFAKCGGAVTASWLGSPREVSDVKIVYSYLHVCSSGHLLRQGHQRVYLIEVLLLLFQIPLL